MKLLRLIFLLACAAAAGAAELKQDLSLTGLLNSLKAGAVFTNNGTITNSGTIGGAGVFNFSSGTLTLADNQVGWAKVSKSGSSLADLATRTFASLQATPTTLAGYGITDAQPLDAELSALAGLTSAADRLACNCWRERRLMKITSGGRPTGNFESA